MGLDDEWRSPLGNLSCVLFFTLHVELRDGCGNMAHIILCEFSTFKTKIIALLTYIMDDVQ